MRIDYKPISVNTVWTGRRFKTPAYKKYERDILLLLPRFKVPEGKLRIELIFGFSNVTSDIDNPIKPLLDILQKKYGFNDSRIYEMHVVKQVVKKKKEFIEFKIESYGRR